MRNGTVIQDRVRQMACLAPATRKTEIAKNDNEINKVLADVKQKNCVFDHGHFKRRGSG